MHDIHTIRFYLNVGQGYGMLKAAYSVDINASAG